MRILYFTNYQGPLLVERRRIVRNRALGASTKVMAIATALSHCGHDVAILSLGTPAERSGRWYHRFYEEPEQPAGLRVEYMPTIDLPLLNALVGARAARRHVRRATYDLALIYNIDREQIAVAQVLASKRVPIVFEYEDDVCATLTGGAGSRPRGRTLLRNARKLAAGAITVNNELRRQLGLPTTEVIHGTVSEQVLALPLRSLADREPIRMLYAGGLTVAKGVPLLLKAIRLIHAHVELTIVGNGPLLAYCYECATHVANVRVLGEINREQLDGELARAHVCVNPHLAGSGRAGTLFPFKVAEYIGSGACVVSSPLGDAPEWVRDAVVTYQEDTPEALAAAIDLLAADYTGWQARTIAAKAYVRRELSENALRRKLDRLVTLVCESRPSPL